MTPKRIKAAEMIPGRQYRLLKPYEGKDVFECQWLNKTTQKTICNPPGEPSMQDSVGIPFDEEVEELT